MKTTIKVLAVAISILALGACNKGGDSEPQTAGKGGSASFTLAPKHHAQNIDSCMVYLKYNAKTGPATTAGYDDSMRVQMVNNEPVATFSGLQKGRYFIYGEGYDPFIKEKVIGGQTFLIEKDINYNLVVAVTEAKGH